MNSMKHLEEFVRDHFGELLLAALFVMLVWIGVFATADETKRWLMTEAAALVGAIINLITGKRKAQIEGKVTNQTTVTETTQKEGE